MKAQSVIAQTGNLLSNSKVNGSSLDKQKKATNDFSNLFNNNLKSNSESEKKINQESNKDSIEKYFKTNVVNNSNPKVVLNETDTNKDLPVDMTQNNDDLQAMVIKSIEELMQQVQTTVCDTLNISKEELEKAMETLGLTMVDLLNPEKLTQLALNVNGIEISDLLTNEDLANTISELTKNVDELVKSQDLNLTKEEIAVILDEVEEGTTLNPKQNVVAEVMDHSVNTQSTNQTDTILEVHNLKGELTQNLSNETKDASSFESKTDDTNQNEADVEMKSPLDTFIQNLSVAGKDTNLGFTEQISNLRQMQEITNQIVEQIKVFIKPDQTSMELQLNPESLGKINLSVVSKDGIITAQFTAQNEIAKEAIESQMHTLRESLNSQGLKVESIEVTVSNFDFGQSNQAATGGKSKQGNSQRRNFIDDEANITSSSQTENALDSLLEQDGNSIDYSA